jgi:hypothetical protein
MERSLLFVFLVFIVVAVEARLAVVPQRSYVFEALMSLPCIYTSSFIYLRTGQGCAELVTELQNSELISNQWYLRRIVSFRSIYIFNISYNALENFGCVRDPFWLPAPDRFMIEA